MPAVDRFAAASTRAAIPAAALGFAGVIDFNRARLFAAALAYISEDRKVALFRLGWAGDNAHDRFPLLGSRRSSRAITTRHAPVIVSSLTPSGARATADFSAVGVAATVRNAPSFAMAKPSIKAVSDHSPGPDDRQTIDTPL